MPLTLFLFISYFRALFMAHKICNGCVFKNKLYLLHLSAVCAKFIFVDKKYVWCNTR